MNADHFTSWIKKTCNMLRTDLENIFPFQGSEQKICLVLDNALWHNKQTEFSRIPSRSWNKAQVYDWLTKHNVPYFDQYSKAELIELSRANAPPKQYITDEVAAEFDIEILRLPIKHCMLNPIEIAWGGMKNFIRDQNTTFKLEEVRTLVSNWLAACDETAATGVFHHVQKYEETFKKADHFIETIELTLVDDADDDTADDDAIDDDDSDAASDDDELKLGIGEEEDEDN
ncbi:unnamed protein product [Rotaria sp. Silwood2]|nr:unnamed protein product [Rotaria sp. Silwood2]